MAVELLDNKYSVIRILGEGGFGRVLLAQDVLLQGRHVAIKVLKNEDPEFQKELINEMKLLHELNFPSIVIFHHHFLHDNRLHLVMEYCEKGSLRGFIHSNKYKSIDEIISVGIKLADVLNNVHLKGIVHHDIKPDNLLITKSDEIKIGDFGIANQRGGTLPYMPPEAFFQSSSTANDP